MKIDNTEVVEVAKPVKQVDESRCPICGAELHIAGSKYIAKNDATPDKETEIYVELQLVCPNIKCDNYSGADTKKSKKIVKTRQNKVS